MYKVNPRNAILKNIFMNEYGQFLYFNKGKSYANRICNKFTQVMAFGVYVLGSSNDTL